MVKKIEGPVSLGPSSGVSRRACRLLLESKRENDYERDDTCRERVATAERADRSAERCEGSPQEPQVCVRHLGATRDPADAVKYETQDGGEDKERTQSGDKITHAKNLPSARLRARIAVLMHNVLRVDQLAKLVVSLSNHPGTKNISDSIYYSTIFIAKSNYC